MAKKTRKDPVNVKVRILRELPEVYPRYQPEIGEVYDAIYAAPRIYDNNHAYSPVCSIKVLDKHIFVGNLIATVLPSPYLFLLIF